MKKKFISIKSILWILTLVALICAITIPRYLLTKKYNSQKNTVEITPENYYLASSTALAKRASQILSPSEKIKLVTGSWSSTGKEVSISESTVSEITIVDTAKDQIEYLHILGIYPYSVKSDYNNWYSYSSKLYEYADTSFRTYTSYLWCITFTKYDNSLTHTVYLTDDGIILQISCNQIPDSISPIAERMTLANIKALFKEDCTYLESKEISGFNTYKTKILTIFPSPEPTENTSIKPIESILAYIGFSNNAKEYYYLYRYQTKTDYVFGMIPYDVIK